MTREHVDVAIIGAGPCGAIAAALLQRKGHRPLVLERETFPRFSIGESLLPQCMEFIEQAGMLPAVRQQTEFQHKNGAAFRLGDRYTTFDFRQKFSPGHETTYQVPRGTFDKVLADEAARQGAEIRYRHEVTAFHDDVLSVTDHAGKAYEVEAKFVLDASGFGRVLPRLLDLESPSPFPTRKAIFTHVEDRISHPGFDREKILVTIHPQQRDIWFWLIPFGDGRTSIGVVGEPKVLDALPGDNADRLWGFIRQAPELAALLQDARLIAPVRELIGYAANVKTFAGRNFALLGNAAEFLDPVFSSGVTIAMKSAALAVDVLDRQLHGKPVNWQTEFTEPLQVGIRTFKTFVTAWYDQRLQEVIFYRQHNPQIRAMICSILAGYAWDQKNPYVAESERRVATLATLCRNIPPAPSL
jgi:flavin-dependent dehydrogenase